MILFGRLANTKKTGRKEADEAEEFNITYNLSAKAFQGA
jgi:hypothetical protein